MLWLLAASAGGVAEPPPRRGRQLYSIPEEHLADVEQDPWVPCRRNTAEGVELESGFCRLSCVAKWSYAPHRMDCEMLEQEELLKRAFGLGQTSFRELSQNSFSKAHPPGGPLSLSPSTPTAHSRSQPTIPRLRQVNSGESDPSDSDVG